jgi:hypothetical protein
VTIGKKTFTKQHGYAIIKMPIFKISDVGYSKLYHALLNLKKVVISACFNVTMYIEFELLNYQLVYLVN